MKIYSYKAMHENYLSLFAAVVKRAIDDLYSANIYNRVDAYAFLSGKGDDLEWWCDFLDVSEEGFISSVRRAHGAQMLKVGLEYEIERKPKRR